MGRTILTGLLVSLVLLPGAVWAGAADLIDSLDQRIGWLEHRIAQERWDLYTTGESDSLEFFEEFRDWVLGDETRFLMLRDSLRSLEGERRRIAEILFPMMAAEQVAQDKAVAAVEDSLLDLLILFQPEYKGERYRAGELRERFWTEETPSDRELAYRAANATEPEVGDLLGRLFRLRNQAASKLGYANYPALIFSQTKFDLEDYQNIISVLDTLTDPAYNELIDNRRSAVPSGQPDVWHLIGGFGELYPQMSWYFPVDSQFTYMNRGLNSIGFNIQDMPIYFSGYAQGIGDSPAMAVLIRPPHDHRVAVDQRNGLWPAERLMTQIGLAIASSKTNETDPILKRLRPGVWWEATIATFRGLFNHPQWLRRHVNIPNSMVQRYTQARAARDLVALRLALVRMAFEYEAYANPNRDLNALYWDTYDRYMRLPRHEDLSPWAAEPDFVMAPLTQHHEVLGQIIADQTLGYMDRFQQSVVRSIETRSFLIQNYYRFGSRYDWEELLERGTGERLTPEYILRTIEP